MTGWSRESFESDHYSFESVFADLPPRKTDLDFPFDRAFPGIRTDFLTFDSTPVRWLAWRRRETKKKRDGDTLPRRSIILIGEEESQGFQAVVLVASLLSADSTYHVYMNAAFPIHFLSSWELSRTRKREDRKSS